MKRDFKGLLLLCMPVALLLVGACTPKPPVTEDETKYTGESCTTDSQCVAGNSCSGGICRKICESDNDCKVEEEQCINSLCVPRQDPLKYYDIEEGETCDDNHICATGLNCIKGKCKLVCKRNEQCNSDQYCKDGDCVARPDPGLMGANCDNDIFTCETGLECVDGKCAKACQTPKDCPTDGKYFCVDGYCLRDDDEGPTTTREKVILPSGGVITPVSGVVKSEDNSDRQFTIRILGGAMQNQTGNEDKLIRVQDGAWKQPTKE